MGSPAQPSSTANASKSGFRTITTPSQFHVSRDLALRKTSWKGIPHDFSSLQRSSFSNFGSWDGELRVFFMEVSKISAKMKTVNIFPRSDIENALYYMKYIYYMLFFWRIYISLVEK